ncbi:neuraminidase-like domain-containing protein [Pseudomonas brassicacearum]|uniref:Tc toxin subunit A-related protein n=1 Tax=Pseudomonas brassicacearum TaxID=930166 RepID=UPI001BDE6478|nr:neuraminidase-like domain-containing protein [Pseudomonas brassicacearum]
MTTAFDAPLNESFRDAMLALYLHEAVPSDEYLIEQGLADRIKSADDLYEFWLLDVLVSQNVPTSPVACAIASLQQLINSMMLNMEPGYHDDSLTPEQTNAWRGGLNRYPTWAAIQQLHYFPDIYLDPTLRLTKTDSFEQLENDINQAQIQPDTVQSAVLAYLARFEEIANLKVCNGYIDGEDFANSTYYFIGKSPAENAYYWRSLDMSLRPVKQPGAALGDVPDKYDKPLPNAWTDWKKANVPISEKALEHTIRPCWFNNRLFVVWAEVDYQDPDAVAPEGRADMAVKIRPRFRLYASYKKYDDNWSAPRAYIESYCQTHELIEKTPAQIERETQTIAVYDHSTSPESLVLMLYSHYQPDNSDSTGDKDAYDFLRTVRIDKNFNVTTLFPLLGVVPEPRSKALMAEDDSRAHVLFIGYIFANANKNAGRFQYWLPSGTPAFGSVSHYTPDEEVDTWNFNGWQSRIKVSEKDIDLVYDRTQSNIELTVRLTEGFDDHGFQPTLAYQLFIGHATDVQSDDQPTTFTGIRQLGTSGLVRRLPMDSTLKYTFSIDQTTQQPDGWPVIWPAEPEDLNIPLIYGVLIFEGFIQPWRLKGGALKALAVGWGETLDATPQIAPSINRLLYPDLGDSPSLGKAQFIDFTHSSIEMSDGLQSQAVTRAPIRMNTVFARELTQLAESGMETLLKWETQTHRIEPPIPNDQGSEPMDFAGAYYLYFLELFLYLPWLVAHRLNEEQQYDEARHWLSYVFDPDRQSVDPGHPGYWQAVPLETPVWPGPADPSQAILYPDDPHQIALSFPVHFRKALYGLYIDIEGNQADQAYRELTPDGLADAKLRYVHILDLLGKRPDVRQVDDWAPITLETLSAAKNEELRGFEQQLIETQRHLQQDPPLRIGTAPASEAAPLLCLRPYAADSSLSGTDNPYLRRPFNPELIQRWDRAESRLYNLRHNLDMAGNALNLPLFAAPLDPRALLAAWRQGLSGAALSRLLSPQIPHYRFSFMFALAQNAVESVIQFGATLLSLIERKEQAQYLELQQQQAWNLAKAALDIQIQAVKIDEANKQALLASQAIVAGRVDYYEKLLNDGVSGLEVAAGAAFFIGGAAQTGASIVQAVAESLKGAPNIIGLSFGGQRIEGPAYSVVAGLQAISSRYHTAGQLMDRIESYRRRTQEWTQARDQAKLEANQIKAQLTVFDAQHRATQLQLRQAQTALNQAKATHDFLLSSNRFSRSQTYDWLNSKFASFYYSAYATAQSLCQAAEACWQYEIGDFTQTYIRPGAWNATYRGLGAGEELKMSLLQMHREYLQNNRRELEIRKTVSLKELKNKDASSTINKTWEEIQAALKNDGTCAFELTQKMFDDDYEGQDHYLRRIKTISVSLPVTVGPYEDICAVLNQSYSKVEMATTVGTAKENLRASQQLALSHGIDDNGQFQLNFQDERYLPFEYTGAISRWTLTFPNPDAQEAMLESLTDIVIHLSYTARRSEGS